MYMNVSVYVQMSVGSTQLRMAVSRDNQRSARRADWFENVYI